MGEKNKNNSFSKPILSAQEALEHASRPPAAAGEGAGSVWLDARAGARGREAYGERHVHGAFLADLDRDLAATVEDPAQGGRHPLPAPADWALTLGSWGITPESAVLIYDQDGGAMAAARAWWMLRASGHARVAVVDGGWQALLEAGCPVDAAVPEFRNTAPYPFTDWEGVVDAEAVEGIRLDPARRLLDARSNKRFLGIEEPFDPVAGHIPGAQSAPFAEFLVERAGGGRSFPAPGALENLVETCLGNTDAKDVVAYCGSGVTACQLILALASVGKSGAQLYPGSWSEWCRSEREKAP